MTDEEYKLFREKEVRSLRRLGIFAILFITAGTLLIVYLQQGTLLGWAYGALAGLNWHYIKKAMPPIQPKEEL